MTDIPPRQPVPNGNSQSITWSDRFRGAMLGGAVGDALGAAVRDETIHSVWQWFGPHGVSDYLPVFGRRGAATELTQLTAFTLEALLRAKAEQVDPAGPWLPTEFVRANHLRWLYTQGVPWEYAMRSHLPAQPEPNGWLLERPELFSTRNPAGASLRGIGRLATQPGPNAGEPPLGTDSLVDCVVWTAPTMVWASTEGIVFKAGADVAYRLTADGDTQAASGLHADVLARLIRATPLWDAVAASESYLARLYQGASASIAVRRTIHAAMSAARGQRPDPATLDIEFDTAGRLGELGIALTCVANCDSFTDAVLMAINHSADSSVTGALAGQLAGAIHGPAAIPEQWLAELELGEILETLCTDAAEAFAPPPPPPPLPRWAQRYVADSRNSFAGPLQLEPSEPSVAATADTEPLLPVDGHVTDARERSWWEQAAEHTAGIRSSESKWEPEPQPDTGSPTQVLPVIDAAVVDGEGTGAEWGSPDPPESPSWEVPEPYESAWSVPADPAKADPGPVEQSFPASTEPAPPEADIPAEQVRGFEPDPAGFAAGNPVADDPLTPYADAAVPDTGVSMLEDVAAEVPEWEFPVEAVEGTEDPETAEGMQAAGGTEDAETSPPVEPAAAAAVPEPSGVPQREGGDHAAVEEVDAVAPSLTERVLGCFLGGALGDALGADLAVSTAEEITERFGPNGPTGLHEAYGVHGAITDDTQMTLFTAEGLIRAGIARRTLGREDPLPEIQLAYQRWLHTQGVEWEAAAGPLHAECPEPDGWLVRVPGLFVTRAPGKTVFRSLERFGRGYGQGSPSDPVNDSKGCGGAMRAAPAALWSSDPAEVFELAAHTAALTHGHPSGYLSAGAFAVIVQQAVLGRGLDDGVWLALQVLETWEGHEETSKALAMAVDLAAYGVPTPQQIAETLGGGWVGEQALAIAVCATLAAGDDVELALRTAVHHSGDSDSTGAICGNIIGALIGIAGLPVAWLAELELRDVVEQVAMDCVAEFDRIAEIDEQDPEHAHTVPPVDEDWHERYPVGPEVSDALGAVDDPPTRLLAAVEEDGGLLRQPVEGESVEPEHPVGAVESPDQEVPGEMVRDVAADPEPGSTGEAGSTGEYGMPAQLFDVDSRQPKPAPRRINSVARGNLGASSGTEAGAPESSVAEGNTFASGGPVYTDPDLRQDSSGPHGADDNENAVVDQVGFGTPARHQVEDEHT
ncbi:ADP-ribosylglycohydrolase family protein [Haloactinomyces albus]|uniref:ADP-ribosylglycohydrolase n=1 Tax=Haloactinomyces albus TaxID=1352928 RepID=A0AAE3ZCL9_9ACTN|nr:ADP-ribosylglycohydrolase family protein [Haloactinomyces albus]MDR7302463.1 ADP-ribosylglycohydrolase [Haloactinomyces albus]